MVGPSTEAALTSCPKGSFINVRNFSSRLSSRESRAFTMFDGMVVRARVCVVVGM
jgi:hypothetical protein